ncbi:MAG: monooxygenase [Gaiellaceae bacterium]|nr:MAG: monooxygenase [Gaiellaceae bacterium]
MPTLLQIDFPLSGPWGEEMAEAFADLARLIADTPGLRWKVWTENEATGESGGIYLFDDEASARAYLDEHTRRLEGFGITGIRARIFDVNEPLTAITRGPLS